MTPQWSLFFSPCIESRYTSLICMATELTCDHSLMRSIWDHKPAYTYNDTSVFYLQCKCKLQGESSKLNLNPTMLKNVRPAILKTCAIHRHSSYKFRGILCQSTKNRLTKTKNSIILVSHCVSLPSCPGRYSSFSWLVNLPPHAYSLMHHLHSPLSSPHPSIHQVISRVVVFLSSRRPNCLSVCLFSVRQVHEPACFSCT